MLRTEVPTSTVSLPASVGPARRKFSINLLKCGIRVSNSKPSFNEYKEIYMMGETARMHLRIGASAGEFESNRTYFLNQLFEMVNNFLRLPFNNPEICITGLETLGDLFSIVRDYRSALVYYFHGVICCYT